MAREKDTHEPDRVALQIKKIPKATISRVADRWNRDGAEMAEMSLTILEKCQLTKRYV